MSDSEYLELLTLSIIALPNMDPKEYNVKLAANRQLELFRKAVKQYAYAEEVTIVE